MAAIKAKLVIPATIVLSPGVAKTVAQLKAPAQQRLKILGFSLSFNGSTAQLPVTVRFLVQTSAGTSLVSETPLKTEPELTETLQATCQVGANGAQTEPTNSGAYKSIFIPAYSGEEYLETPGNEDIVAGGTYYGIECTNPASNGSINVAGHVLYEE